MKSQLLWLGLLLGCVALMSPLTAQDAKDPPAAKDKKEPEKTDITDLVREMNSAKFASPPTEFRGGHVNPKMLDAKAIKKTDAGFTIQLPSGAPIPTPTVYKGKLYVSGGFSTREYFCFDAITGKLEWGMNLDDDGPTSAVCDDDIVVFNTESCTIFALDAKTGKNLWSHFLGDPLTSTPTIANGKVFTSYPAMGGGGGANNKIDLPLNANVTQAQVVPAKGGKAPVNPNKNPPAQAKPRPNASHVMICLDLKTGKILWQKWIDGDAFWLTDYYPPLHGEMVLYDDGSFVYTPTLNFVGTDDFIYRAYDGVTYSDWITATIQVIDSTKYVYLPLIIR